MDLQPDPIEIPPPYVFDCGCMISSAIENGEKVTKMAPCRMGCDTFALFLREAADQHKPVQYREA